MDQKEEKKRGERNGEKGERKERRKIGKRNGDKERKKGKRGKGSKMGKRKGKGKRGVSAHRRQRPSARARGQWRVRPALIAVGGRAMRRWRGKRERGRGMTGEKGKVASMNGIGNRVFGTEKRFSEFRVQVLGGSRAQRRKRVLKKNLACALFSEFFGSLQPACSVPSIQSLVH